MLEQDCMSMQKQKEKKENQKELSTKTDIGWGHQIISFCKVDINFFEIQFLVLYIHFLKNFLFLDSNIFMFTNDKLKSYIDNYFIIYFYSNSFYFFYNINSKPSA